MRVYYDRDADINVGNKNGDMTVSPLFIAFNRFFNVLYLRSG